MEETLQLTPAQRVDSRSNISILVADDHKLVRSVLCAYLRTHSWGSIASAPTVDSALRILRERHFDIFLLDLHMPGVEGYKTIADVSRSLQETHVVVWTGSNGPDVARSCLESGARGFIPKDMSLDLLLPALNLVKSGETFVPGKYIFEMHNSTKSEQTVISELSEDELSILQMIGKGLQNKSIALQIGKTETNVKAITRKIFMKIGAKNRAHATHIAEMKGWLRP